MPSDLVMHKFKHGDLHSGSKTGPKVKNRKQAIAIGQSEGSRQAGLRVHVDEMDTYASTAEQDSDCRRGSSLCSAPLI